MKNNLKKKFVYIHNSYWMTWTLFNLGYPRNIAALLDRTIEVYGNWEGIRTLKEEKVKIQTPKIFSKPNFTLVVLVDVSNLPTFSYNITRDL